MLAQHAQRTTRNLTANNFHSVLGAVRDLRIVEDVQEVLPFYTRGV